MPKYYIFDILMPIFGLLAMYKSWLLVNIKVPIRWKRLKTKILWPYITWFGMWDKIQLATKQKVPKLSLGTWPKAKMLLLFLICQIWHRAKNYRVLVEISTLAFYIVSELWPSRQLGDLFRTWIHCSTYYNIFSRRL